MIGVRKETGTVKNYEMIGSLPVIFISVTIHRKFILEPRAASSLHMYSQILSCSHDLP